MEFSPHGIVTQRAVMKIDQVTTEEKPACLPEPAKPALSAR
jgi:hypothetical protein